MPDDADAGYRPDDADADCRIADDCCTGDCDGADAGCCNASGCRTASGCCGGGDGPERIFLMLSVLLLPCCSFSFFAVD